MNMKRYSLEKIFFLLVISFTAYSLLLAQDRGGRPQPDASAQESEPAAPDVEAEPAAEEDISFMEIRRLETEKPRYSIELRQAPLQDFFRLIAHDYDFNLMVDERVRGRITVSFTNVSLEQVLEMIAREKGLVIDQDNDIMIVRPQFITRVFSLRHLSLDFVLGEEPGADVVVDDDDPSITQRGRRGDIYDLLSRHGKIIPNRHANSIVVIDYPRNVEKVERFIEVVDSTPSRRVFKIEHFSIKELFPEILERERDERSLRRDERAAERDEIEGLRGTGGD